MRHWIKTLIIAICMAVLGPALSLQAQSESDSAGLIVNPQTPSDSLMYILQTYVGEMQQFQVYNDSMYMGLDSLEWIPFFKRRAQRFSSYYKVNIGRVKELKRLLDVCRESDLREFSDSVLSDTCYQSQQNARFRLVTYLYEAITSSTEQRIDVFLYEDLLERIGPDMERLMPHSVYTYLYYYTLARCKYLIAQTVQDETRAEAWYYFNKVIEMESEVKTFVAINPVLVYPYIFSLYFSIDLQFVYYGVVSLDEMMASERRVEQILSSHASYFDSEEGKKSDHWLKNTVGSFPMRIITQLVWKTDYSYHSARTDSVALSYIYKIEHESKEMPSETIINLWKMKVYMGQMSADKARRLLYSHLKLYVFDRYQNLKRNKLNNIFAIYFFPMLYFNDASTASEASKTRVVEEVCDQMVKAIRACQNTQEGDVKAGLASHYVTHPLVLRHLPLEKRELFLFDMFVSCQVQTVTHSRMVSMLSLALLDGVIAHRPELLKDLPAVASPQKLLKSKRKLQKLREFMEKGAFCHDLGKVTMAEIVRNDFRPLTDHEFAIIKQHPERGLQFLKVMPENMKYKDLLLGHHKWYNGQRGYPDTFDNVASPYRILVDIVTISDCLEAATDQMGRRYSNAKNFDSMMRELKAGAGTRYNADLVELMETCPDVAQKMRYLVEEGWAQNYYQIYHTYFNNDRDVLMEEPYRAPEVQQ